jgi:serine/threonine-protein kinase RsbW
MEPAGETEESVPEPKQEEILAPPSEEHVIELRLPPKADMELIAANNIEQLGGRCGYPDKAISQIKMATLEACLNAIEHSQNKEKEVRVRLEATAQKFTVLVENEGVVFDPLAVEDPNIEDKLHQSYKRGWGLKLIQKFMDRVVSEPYDRGTRLRMEKVNAAAPPAPSIKG